MTGTGFKPRTALALVLFMCIVALAPAHPQAQSGEKNFISIGTGSVTGVYYPAGGSICHLLNRGRRTHGIRCSVESSSGSAENIKNIRANEIDFGVVQSDTQYQAVNGLSVFADDGPYDDLRAVMSLYFESFTLVARTDSNINSINDLPGKRVNLGNPGSGQRGTMDSVMKAMGWTEDTFAEVHELKASEQSRALCDGVIDAMVYTVGHPNASIKEATALCDSILAEVTGAEISKLVSDNHYYSFVTIPGGMYRGTDYDINTFGVGATLVTSANMSEEVVYEMVKSVFDNIETFRELHPAFSDVDTTKMASEGLSAPIHPGAIRYYREKGIIK
ncbi:MAG: TAXI family TRAP transporter solute-binding subunit [Rhodospirillaceae bacterium]|nr:TAXI family TRAP transporter solute-binding subunit [Rhodospirillaceae bacterium]